MCSTALFTTIIKTWGWNKRNVATWWLEGAVANQERETVPETCRINTKTHSCLLWPDTLLKLTNIDDFKTKWKLSDSWSEPLRKSLIMLYKQSGCLTTPTVFYNNVIGAFIIFSFCTGNSLQFSGENCIGLNGKKWTKQKHYIRLSETEWNYLHSNFWLS